MRGRHFEPSLGSQDPELTTNAAVLPIVGVTNVQCSVEKQQILVEGDADETVMLEALQKWSKASGKSVALA